MEIATVDKPVIEKTDFVKLVKDGDYFKEMDRAIMYSPTASMAVLMFKKYCVLPNIKKEFLPYWEKIKDEKIKYGFFTLWIEYNSDFKVIGAHFRLSKQYRVKKKDNLGKASTYLNVITGAEFPAFNSDPLVVKSQVEKAGGFEKFKGQIYQYNTTTADYEFSPFVPVFNWMKIEADTPTHVTSAADNALFGNNIFVMKKASESSNDPADENSPRRQTNTDRVLNALRNAKSVKKSGVNHVLTVDTEEDVTKIFTKVDISNTVDIDKFNTVDEKAVDKICLAAYCFPKILANPSEGLFGSSGEALNTAIAYWQSTCEFEARKIEKAFEEIGIPLQDQTAEVQQEEETESVDQTTLDAQAALKGSVGGVTSLLQVQTSYSAGTTSRGSAIAILKYIFGFDDAKAAELLGDPITPQEKAIIDPLTPQN